MMASWLFSAWRGLASAVAGIVAGRGTAATDPGPAESEDGADSLAAALADGQFCIEYQPKLHLRQQRIASVEALIRWQHPERGLIPPGEFIPAAEKGRHIAALTSWVVERSIADQRALAADGHDIAIFVNIAASLLADRPFVTGLCARIEESGASIGLEITETSVIRDPEAAIENLRHVAAQGIPIAIDDYGAGLSSLVYLKRLPACELKIDKVFITDISSSSRDPLIVRSTIDLAHAMEMEVVAEGVETQTALALLSVMGCDMAQGYFISRPLRIADLRRFLDERKEGWTVPPSGGRLTIARRAGAR